ncbi:GAP family protein [Arthrobacter gandavensis]|uniref:GAP family protein n=1 Tax=Arthrobacter gandavensis TaxID=169960 RepID=UPI00188F42B7|nr:GAP family protein [Arthrobacter gandavensis]MBF4993115.1 GAP family protein [Arthrobacter gandavensis]
MTLETFVQLGVLALIDSTSIGTLVIPVWLLMRRDAGRTTGKVAAYLGAVGVFYFLVGLLLLSGAAGIGRVLGGGVGSFLELPAVQVLMIAAGAGMLIWSFKDTSFKGQSGGGEAGAGRSGAEPAAAAGAGDTGAGDAGGAGGGASGNGRAAAVLQRSQATEHRWQRRIGKALDSRGGLLGLALLAGVLELPTMLPYLAAVGVLTSAGVGWSVSAGMLALYCLVMLLPALLLVLLRCVLGRHLDGPLERLRGWLSKVSGEAVLWVVGIVGFLMLRAGLAGLFPGASWNPFG